MDDEHSSLEANYGWVVKLEKGDFVGRSALETQKASGLKRRLTGLRLTERGVPRAGAAVYIGERKAGRLCSATFSPTLQAGIGVGYLEPADLQPGAACTVEIHGKRLAAEIAPVPFYKRK